MSKRLKTMSVNDLLEELAVCNNETTLNNLKVLAGYELEGQDDVTKEVIMKVLYYQQYTISKDRTALNKLLGVNHWEQMMDENKAVFYTNAVHFLKGIDIPMVLQILNEQMPYDKGTRDKLSASKEALQSFERRYQEHVLDYGDLNKKKESANLEPINN
jgi:hypothetical protein